MCECGMSLWETLAYIALLHLAYPILSHPSSKLRGKTSDPKNVSWSYITVLGLLVRFLFFPLFGVEGDREKPSSFFFCFCFWYGMCMLTCYDWAIKWLYNGFMWMETLNLCRWDGIGTVGLWLFWWFEWKSVSFFFMVFGRGEWGGRYEGKGKKVVEDICM